GGRNEQGKDEPFLHGFLQDASGCMDRSTRAGFGATRRPAGHRSDPKASGTVARERRSRQESLARKAGGEARAIICRPSSSSSRGRARESPWISSRSSALKCTHSS